MAVRVGIVRTLTAGGQALLERDAELAELGSAVATLGRTVLIEGPAGVGKSALLLAAGARARESGQRVLRATGGEFERDYAFGAMRQLLEPVLVNAPARQLAGAAAAAPAIVAPVGAPVEAGAGILHALYWFIANMAAEEPLLLVVDDLHWCDEASLRALDYLARRIDGLPVAIVGTLRPSEPGSHAELLDALRTQPAVTVLLPAPLSHAAVTSLVAARRSDAGPDVASAYHAASSGNPLYLRELLHTVPAGTPEEIRAAAVPVLAERIVRRVRRVAPEAVPLASAMALSGPGQPLSLAVELAGIEPALAAELARELVRIDVLAAEDPPEFSHPVIRHSLYEELSSARQASMHGQAAELLDRRGAPADAVAGHLAALPLAASDAVAAGLHRAGLEAFARGDADAAVTRLRRALAEGADAPSRAELLFDLSRALVAKRDPECLALLQEAFVLAPPSLRPEIAAVSVEVLSAAGMWEAAWETIEAARSGAVTGDVADELEAIRALMRANDPARIPAFLESWDQLAALSTGDGWPARALAAVLGCRGAEMSRPPEEVRGFAQTALRDDALLASRGAGSWATVQLISALIGVGDYETTAAFAERLTAAGLRAGAALATATSSAAEVWLCALRGELMVGEARARSLFAISAEAQMTMWLATMAHMTQDILVERPTADDLRVLIDELELPPAFMRTRGGSLLSEARGRVALAHGDRRAAVAHYRFAESINRALRVGPAISPWRSQLALALGTTEEASALVDEEIRLADGYPRARGVALRARGVLHGDIEALRESVEILSGTQAVLEVAYAHFELGARLRRTRRLAEAREHLGEAAELAQRCGAERLLARATDELRATGARPRRLARSGLDALTPRELHVAEMAAAGRANTEIAQELYVSLKTVEAHLSKAYSKLGLTGQGARRALAAALAA